MTSREQYLTAHLANEYLKQQQFHERFFLARRLVGRTVLLEEHTRRLGVVGFDPRDTEPDDDPEE